MAYVGIKPSRVLVKNVLHQNQGMDAGVVFQPISFKTLPGLNEHHPYGPYCNLKDGRNPIFAKVTGTVSRVRARSGNYLVGTIPYLVRAVCVRGERMYQGYEYVFTPPFEPAKM
jgi:hypothetical protein